MNDEEHASIDPMECDVTILYCQGCGACAPDDGSRCGPKCPVQLFPMSGDETDEPIGDF